MKMTLTKAQEKRWLKFWWVHFDDKHFYKETCQFLASELSRQKKEIGKDLMKGLKSSYAKGWLDMYCDEALERQKKEIIKKVKKSPHYTKNEDLQFIFVDDLINLIKKL